MSGVLMALAGACKASSVQWIVANSSTGDDANDGVAAPVQTLSRAATLTTASANVKLSGSWGGSSSLGAMYKPSNSPKQVVGVIGSTLPKLDCAKAISAGAWSLDSDPSGVIYTASLSPDANALTSNSALTIWEDGAWLTHVADKATCVSTPGSMYAASPFMSTSSPTVVYIHASDGGNPASNGKLYEQTYYSDALRLAEQSNFTVSNIWTRRDMSSLGSSNGGSGSTFKNCVFGMGAKHNIVTAGNLDSCVAWDCDLSRANLPIDNGYIPITIYKSDATGISATITKCMALMPSGRSVPASSQSPSVYCHGSNGTAPDNITLDKFISSGMGNFSAASLVSWTANDYVSLNNGTNLVSLGGSCLTTTINRAIVKVPNSHYHTLIYSNTGYGSRSGNTLTMRDAQVYGDNASSATSNCIDVNTATTLDIQYNTIRYDNRMLPAFATISALGSNSVISRNIFVLAYNAAQYIFDFTGASQYPAMDYNVYCNIPGTTWNWTGRDGTNYTSLAAWKAATGLDTHSVMLTAAQTTALFAGSVAAGNFNLSATSGLTFTDGTPIYGNAGARSYYDWNARQVMSAPQTAWPTPPTSEAAAAQWCINPANWTF